MWTHRIMLEAYQHSKNAFVTLTYDDLNVPMVAAGGTLLPEHLTNFIKRLRKRYEPERLRFYAVGEYGDETNRPHYHAALFNFPSCSWLKTEFRRDGTIKCCATCAMVREVWGYGQIYIGNLEAHSAQYVAGYVTKKMTRRDDPRLQGRYPEFSRMSRKPGIGFDALYEVASEWMRFNLDTTQADVPSSLRHGRKELPLGRYLTRKLRALTGKDERTPDEVIEASQEEVQVVRQAAFDASGSFEEFLEKAMVQKTLNFEARMKIHKQRKML